MCVEVKELTEECVKSVVLLLSYKYAPPPSLRDHHHHTA